MPVEELSLFNILSSLLKVIEGVLLQTQTQLHVGEAMVKSTGSILVSIGQGQFLILLT
jgi:hypothetical protein